jgi:hypothetical protein
MSTALRNGKNLLFAQLRTASEWLSQFFSALGLYVVSGERTAFHCEGFCSENRNGSRHRSGRFEERCWSVNYAVERDLSGQANDRHAITPHTMNCNSQCAAQHEEAACTGGWTMSRLVRRCMLNNSYTGTQVLSFASSALILVCCLLTASQGSAQISIPSYGNIATIAGTGAQGCAGRGGLATSAQLNNATGVKVDASGNVYIADQACATVTKITASTGVITTIAGNGTNGYSGDGGAATSAKLNNPSDVAIDSAGNIYIADYSNNRVRKVNTSGVISTYAGTGGWGYAGDGGQATSAELANPSGLALDSSGNLYIADFENKRIRKVATGGIITTVAGNGTGGDTGDGGAATSAEINGVEFLAADAAGDLWLADYYDHVVRKVTASSGIISKVAGTAYAPGYSGDGGAATSAQLNVPMGVAIDSSGNLYISDQSNYRIRMVNSSGIISTIAGNGTKGYSGDGGAATSAELNNTQGLGLDASGNPYIADTGNFRIRVVGSGSGGSSPVLNSLSCTYSTLPAGPQTDACSATLTAPAISAFVVNLSSNNVNVTAPSTVTVPQGSSSAGFTATAAAVSTAQSATLTASAGGVNEQFTIQLTATGPGLSSNASSINFGNVTVNTPSTQTVILTSTGTSSVTINSITVSGTGICTSSLNPRQQAHLTARSRSTAPRRIARSVSA